MNGSWRHTHSIKARASAYLEPEEVCSNIHLHNVILLSTSCVSNLEYRSSYRYIAFPTFFSFSLTDSLCSYKQKSLVEKQKLICYLQ